MKDKLLITHFTSPYQIVQNLDSFRYWIFVFPFSLNSLGDNFDDVMCPPFKKQRLDSYDSYQKGFSSFSIALLLFIDSLSLTAYQHNTYFKI